MGKMSLKRKILIFSAISSIVFMLVSFIVAFLMVGRTMHSITKSNLGRSVQNMKQSIVHNIEEYNYFTKELGTDRLIESMIISFEGAFFGGAFIVGEDQEIYTDQYNAFENRYRSRVESYEKNHKIQDLILISKDGQVIMTSTDAKDNKLLGKNLLSDSSKQHPLASCFSESIANPGSVCQTKFFLDDRKGKVMAYMTARVDAEFDYPSDGISKGEAMGVVAIGIDTNFILESATQGGKFGDSAYAYVINDDGIPLASVRKGSETITVTQAFSDQVKLVKSYPLRLKQGEILDARYTNDLDTRVYASSATIDGLLETWHVALEVDSQEVLAPLKSLMLWLGVALGLSFIGTLTLSQVFAVRVSKPLIVVDTKIQGIVEDLKEDAEALSHECEVMSEGSQSTATALQHSLSSMSEINSMVQSTLDKIENTTASANSIEDLVKEGGEQIERLVDAVSQIELASDSLKKIGGFMSSISKQTSVINDIVFKTQLLSVNASIEAVKAGEFGRGFTVVADEVSKLAETSGLAATEISELIGSSTEEVAHILEQVQSKVAVGKSNTDQTEALFQSIERELRLIQTGVSDVAEAANEQKVGISGVTQAVADIEKSSNQNLTTNDQINTVSGRLKEHSTQLDLMSHEVKKITLGKANPSPNAESSHGGHPPEEKGHVTEIQEVKPNTAEIARHESSDDNHAPADISADDDSFKSLKAG